MKAQKISHKKHTFLSPLLQDYLQEKETLQHLYKHAPSTKSVPTLIELTNNSYKNRLILWEVVKKQYQSFNLYNDCQETIDSLQQENTYTICVAHQPCVLGGPLYFIYKIISAIKTAQLLKEEYPQYQFVPVYWMGSEDHDFEEINHIHLFGKTVRWNNERNHGAVGRMDTEGLSDFLSDVSAILGQDASDMLSHLNDMVSRSSIYGQFIFQFVHYLFSSYGLIVIDQDDADLKKCFSSVMQEEIRVHFSIDAIQRSISFLKEKYHVQANPNPVNLFYLTENGRHRIDPKDEHYVANGTNLRWTKNDLLKEIEHYPNRFSPNVILRPLYQQTVLPNLITIGGPSEIAYWLELQDVFDRASVFYPMLLLRDMAMIIPQTISKKIEKWEMSASDLFTDTDTLMKQLVAKYSDHNLTLHSEQNKLEILYRQIAEKAGAIDPTLPQSVHAEWQRVKKGVENIERKLTRAEKRNQEQLVGQVNKIKQTLFPDGNLQERTNNFLPYYIRYKQGFFDALMKHFNPFKPTFTIIVE